VAIVLSGVMLTWHRGRRLNDERIATLAPPCDVFLGDLSHKLAGRVPGCGVFLTGRGNAVPLSLVQYVDRIHVLPERVVLLTIDVLHEAHAADDAMRIEPFGDGIVRLTIDRGFMDTPHVTPLLDRAIARFDLHLDPQSVTYCLGRETFLATSSRKMRRVGESFFAFLARTSPSATTELQLPPKQVIEIGMQLDL
jgi:KUP system potassium uptake protein